MGRPIPERAFRTSWSAATRLLPHRPTPEPRFWLAAGLVLIVTVILSLNLVPDRVSIEAGQPSPEEIRARRTVDYIDTEETRRLRDAAAERVPAVYDEVSYAANDSVQVVDDTLHRAETSRTARLPLRGSLTLMVAARKLQPRLPLTLSLDTVATLLSAPPNVYLEIRHSAEQLVGRAMTNDIRDLPTDLPAVRDRVEAETRALPLSRSAQSAVYELVSRALRPNRALNSRRSDRLREDERLSVAPVHRQIVKGDVIVHKDEIVSTDQIVKLRALGLQRPLLEPIHAGLLALILTVLVLLFTLFLRQYHYSVYADMRQLAVIAGVVLISVVGVKAGASVLGLKLSSSTVGYLNLLWIATAAMLITVLIDPHVALAAASLLAVGAGLGLDVELRFVAAAIVSALAGIYAASHVRDRRCLIRMGATLTATNVSLVILLTLYSGESPGTLWYGCCWAIGTGLGSALLFWLGVAVLEHPLGVVTQVGLLELCDTNRPILKRLLMEAPGSYHHSMVVASLCESAADAVGADALLTRAMAYYHDIGKVRRPQFFIENQRVENMHDRLNPSLSMLVIAAHVRDGVEIARELRLPTPIINGIREHHGTGLVSYFYHQAARSEGASAELENQFRYDGPKPQTRETAILMLADGVEASSRLLNKPTPGQIEDLVDGIVHARLGDGQLDECDLTLRDLDKITGSLIRALTGMLHSRIEYPKVITTTEARKVLKYAALDSKRDSGSGIEPDATAEADEAAAAG